MDKTSNTERAIETEFMREYAAKDFDRITVKELCANVPVARTTFYAHYQNTDEVLEAVEDRLISRLVAVADEVSGGDLRRMDFTEFIDRTMAYVTSEWESFRALLIIQPDRRFEDKWKAAIKRHFHLRYPGKVMLANYDLIAEVAASAVLGGYRYWMEHPDDVDAARLNRAMCAMLTAAMDALE